MGTYLPGTGILGWGSWCGAETPRSRDISPKFLSTTCGCGTSLFCICAPPTGLDECGFFNSVLVSFPFNSISDSSEWWLFSILVVILMWLCEEVNHVFLCHHLDQKSLSILISISNYTLFISNFKILFIRKHTHVVFWWIEVNIFN